MRNEMACFGCGQATFTRPSQSGAWPEAWPVSPWIYHCLAVARAMLRLPDADRGCPYRRIGRRATFKHDLPRYPAGYAAAALTDDRPVSHLPQRPAIGRAINHRDRVPYFAPPMHFLTDLADQAVILPMALATAVALTMQGLAPRGRRLGAGYRRDICHNSSVEAVVPSPVRQASASAISGTPKRSCRGSHGGGRRPCGVASAPPAALFVAVVAAVVIGISRLALGCIRRPRWRSVQGSVWPAP